MHTEYVKHLLLQNSIFPLLSRLVLPQEQNIPIIVIYDEEMAANSKNKDCDEEVANAVEDQVDNNNLVVQDFSIELLTDSMNDHPVTTVSYM